MYFEYGEKETEYLKSKDKRLAELITELLALKGIGVWTAEMLLLFCLQRPNVLAMVILQFSEESVWYITIEKSAVNNLRNTAGGSVRIAV